MIRITDTVKHLIIINVLFFVAKYSIHQFDLDDLFGLHYWQNPLFKPWQLVTSMFMHADIGHLFFNMLGLYFFGIAMEEVLGKQRFLFFYFSVGIGASVIYLLERHFAYSNALAQLYQMGANPQEIIDLMNPTKLYVDENLQTVNSVYNVKMLGASGAVFGLLAAFGWYFPNAKMFLIFLPIPIAAKYFIPVIVLADLFSGLSGIPIFSPLNTAYFAHVGGAIIGFIMAYYWKKNHFRMY